jgi:hypothetical protein
MKRLALVMKRLALAALMATLGLSVFSAATPGVVAARHAKATATLSRQTPGYWLVASDGGVFSFGGAPFYGSTGGMALNAPMVGMASTPDGGGYWLVASDGGIFSYGDARFYGSTGGMALNAPVVGMASTPDGRGYWLVASDGGIFTFGDARFYGSMGAFPLNQPVVGMSATPDGRGYWLVASDGGIFSFGDAHFYGSMGAFPLNQPVVGMVTATNGAGYFLVAADGGIFTFGSAPFFGSLGGQAIQRPIVAAAATYDGNGYWFTDTQGLVSNFGGADYDGSADPPLLGPIVGMSVAPGNGSFAGGTYPSGAYGYDVSVYQCGALPSGDHQIGIVQVDGASSAAPNPCLAQEAAWAGGGLNLYTFLTYGTSDTQEPGCYSDAACNAGFAAAVHAFNDAVAAGVNPRVPWWLDVEGDGHWSPNSLYNAIFVQGALTALHEYEGVPDVGIYASPGVWNSIVGDYEPDVPYWMADYLEPPSGPSTCADYARWASRAQLPSGPLQVVQYGSARFDEDYAC